MSPVQCADIVGAGIGCPGHQQEKEDQPFTLGRSLVIESSAECEA